MRRRTNSLSGRQRAFSSLRAGTTRRGGEGFQLLLAPNLLLAHTELATATAGEKTTHLNKKWVPVSYSAVRDFGRINFFVV